MGDHSNLKIPGVNSTGVLFAGEGDSRDSLEDPQSEQSVTNSKVEDAAHVWNLSPRSTLSCNAVERQAFEDGKWTSLQRSDEAAIKASTGFVDDSFRLEDNDALALWEERSPKAVSTDLSSLKPAPGPQSPWLGSVSNAVKKMEILSHAWARTDSKAAGAATLDCPRPSLEYLKRVSGRPYWKDFKIVSSPVRTSETVLNISSKVRHSNKSPCRRPDGTELPFSGPISATPLGSDSSDKLRHSVSCELLIGPSKAVDLNRSRQADYESEPSFRSDSNQGKVVGAGNAPQTIFGATKSAITRQSTKTSAEAMSSWKERCSSTRRSRSMNEAMLIDCGSEAGGQQGNSHSQETREPKASERYYESVASRRKKSSCWNSFDDTHLNHTIDFVAPSAARFLEDEGSFSPVRTPIKTPGAVPFKWEKEPGKPKESDSDSVPTSGQSNIALPLPPRLKVGHCPSVSSSSSQCQCSSPLRSPCGNATMSGSLRELYALPSPRYPSSESQKVMLPWFSASFGNTSYYLRSASPERPERDPCTSAAREYPMRKSKSVGEVRVAPQSYSRLSVGGDARDQGIAPKSYTSKARQPDQQKPAHPSGVVRPPSPTSILCGPDAGSRSSSSDPSLNSEHEAPRISATAISPLSKSSLPALVSFDSIEHRVDNSSELLISGSSLTSPFRATFRTSSASYNPDFEEMRKYLSSTDHQKGETHSENTFVKFCKIGKRWMKTKSQAKLGTNPSPEVWTPRFAIQHDANSDFCARLGEGSSHSQVQTEGYFVPITSTPPQENLGNQSPASAATLGLLTSFKKRKNRQTKPSPRTTWNSTRRLRMRARLRARFLRARFLVPMRRALRTLLTRFTFRHGNKNVKAAGPRLLYEYHLHHRSHSRNDFQFFKPN